MWQSTTCRRWSVSRRRGASASTLTDVVILLSYVEVAAELRRAICVLKMRASAHDTRIHEFTIDGQGLHVGEVFEGASGILAGSILP